MSSITDYCTYEQIKANIKSGKYHYKDPKPTLTFVSESHIFDEDLSVKQNRQMAIEHNERVRDQKRVYLLAEQESRQKFYSDCEESLCYEFGWRFKPEVAQMIIRSLKMKEFDGDDEFLYEMNEIADLVAEIIKVL